MYTIENVSKLSEKRQITIPLSLCKKLEIGAGDRICFDFDPEKKIAVIRKATAADLQWYLQLSKTVMTEWEGIEDDDL